MLKRHCRSTVDRKPARTASVRPHPEVTCEPQHLSNQGWQERSLAWPEPRELPVSRCSPIRPSSEADGDWSAHDEGARR